MREILFKAKRVDNNEWVTGLLTIMWGQYHIINPNDENTAYPIKTETLCEFTGLTDKNGKMIWENDVVKHCADIKLALVEFINGQFSIQKYGYWLQSSDNFEVIGNKFDNPELLEVME